MLTLVVVLEEQRPVAGIHGGRDILGLDGIVDLGVGDGDDHCGDGLGG